METSTPHITFEKLLDLAEDKLTSEDRVLSRKHLSSCSDCTSEFERIQKVIELMRSDESSDAPRDILAYALNIFRAGERTPAPSLLRRIIATLTFDSLNVAPAFGVRSGQATSRQLLYSAEENDIDLRITMEENDRWILSGQVLRDDCLRGRVELEGRSAFVAEDLNEQCEFELPPVPSGKYLLRVRLQDVEVEVPALELEKA